VSDVVKQEGKPVELVHNRLSVVVDDITHVLELSYIGDAEYAPIEDIIRAQKNLAIKLLDTPTCSGDLFNFLVNITGIRSSALAKICDLPVEKIGEWRRSPDGPPDEEWLKIKDFFLLLFLLTPVDEETDGNESGNPDA